MLCCCMTCDTSTGLHQPSQAVSETRIPPEKPRHAPYVHPAALQTGAEPLWVCKGAYDALALLAAGVPRVVAIFGVQGWRWDWRREVRELVFVLDADTAGQ
jgi:DNA primase